MAQDTQTNAAVQGKIVQCIGAVVDVEFPRDHMPGIYDALKLEGSTLTLEVQQQLQLMYHEIWQSICHVVRCGI